MPTIHPTLPADGDDAIVEPYNAALNLILGVLNGSIDSDNMAANSVGLAQLSTTLQGFLVPTATILPFASSSLPTGWLMCDGSSVLRSSYSALFAAISTAYGSADGTHFNLPDLRGRIPIGHDAMSGSAANRIQRTTTITTTNASATATVGSATGLAIGMTVVSANVPTGTKITVISGTTLTLSANATATGSAVAARFSVLSDAATLGGIGGEDVHQLTVAELASHNHTVQAYHVNTLPGGAPDLPMYWGNGGANIASFTSTGTGNDAPHNNLPPSVVVNYIIKI